MWYISVMSESSKKDSTNELPMYDIQEAINIVVTIHEKALETASLPDVAKGCGYANPTSTPFYRRIVAARLFSFLGSPKSELTKLALDYLKPDTDGAKQTALFRAIMGIKTYADIVNQYVGKRPNVELIANKLEKDTSLSITKACAKICATVLVNSLKIAGFIAQDGTVAIPTGSAPLVTPPLTDQVPPKVPPKDDDIEGDHESQVQTLYLDNKRKRKITIKAPLTVTKEELERIRAWLGFQLIIEATDANQEQ
jgi:hypothetical protein